MGKRKNISAVISMKDNMSATLRGIQKEQTKFRREVTNTKKELLEQQRAANKQIDMKFNESRIGKSIAKLKSGLEPLRKKYVMRVAMKEINDNKRKRLKKELKDIGRMIASPVIKIKDKVSSPIKKIKSSLLSMKGLVVAAGIGAAGKALFQQGAELEQQKISMKHFMGVGNKGKSDAQVTKMSNNYLKGLRDNANATPFETGEVIAAGTRSLQISGGNSKEAMKMVKLAEDMAAMNPGKTVGDAMEALADAKTGEMERLKEFGIKASSKDSFDSVKGQLSNLYEGGAEKLSQSGLGLWSTIVGKLKSSMADTGLNMLDAMKPALQGFLGFIDSAMPVINQVGQAIGNGIGGAITFLQSQMPVLGPIFQQGFSAVQGIITTIAPIIGQVIKALWPVFTTLSSIAVNALTAIGGIVKAVAPVVSALIKALGVVIRGVCSAVSAMGRAFSSVFNGIKRVVKSAHDFISPLINGIKSMVSGISDGIGTVTNFVMGQNATGTQYWSGGFSLVGEHGPEVVEMPRGAKVHTNTSLNYMAKRASDNKERYINTSNNSISNIKTSSKNINVHINRLADKFEIKDDRSVSDIAKELVKEIQIASINYGGAY